MTAGEPRVASLHRYPVKSCRGHEMDEGRVERRGFTLDRRFMVVDGEDRFRTQRKDPRLACVDATVMLERLVLEAEGHGRVEIDLRHAEEGETRTTRVWRHTGPSVDQGDAAGAFLSELLGAPSRLVHMADATRRPVNRQHAVSGDDVVGYADGYPFLVVSRASLAALVDEVGEPVPMDRFRANIVVDGGEAWDEDGWAALRIGDVELDVAKACTRCTIVTTDQHSGERASREPLQTLGRVRRTRSGVTFGVYCIPRAPGGTIRRGDVVHVLA